MVSVPVDEAAVPVVARKRVRIEYLDGLRALAALYVVFGHMASEVWSTQNQHKPDGVFIAVASWLGHGYFAVGTFIVLSGFCLMLPVIRNDGALSGGIRGFIARRARRILPPYYLTVLISLALIGTLIGSKTGTIWDSSVPVSVPGLYSHIILTQDLVFPSQIDFPLWSISVEWRIYLLFPLLVYLWRRAGPLRTTVAVCVLSYATYLFLKWVGLVVSDGFNSIVPQYVALFTLGMLGATIVYSPGTLWQRLREHVPWKLVAACAFATFLGIITLATRPDGGLLDGVLGIGALGILVAASRGGRNAVRAALSWKPLVFIGTMSYSLYLLHAPLLQVIWQYGLRPLRLSDGAMFVCLALVGTPLIIACTYLFHLVGERPFMTPVRGHAAPRRKWSLRVRWTAS